MSINNFTYSLCIFITFTIHSTQSSNEPNLILDTASFIILVLSLYYTIILALSQLIAMNRYIVIVIVNT